MIDAHKLSIGLLLPIEAYEGAIPKMENQVQLIQRAEMLGFNAVWVRDIPLYTPDFNEVGQMFDPWIYLAHIATLTQSIKFGFASVILPLRHPLHVAKASASLDVLFPKRFMMGVASGDRPVEYPAFNELYESRSTRVLEHMAMLRDLWSKEFPTYNNEYGTLMEKMGDVVPKPLNKNIPMYATGHIGGVNLEWIAKNSDGWIYYPRDFDLKDDPDFEPEKMDLGFRLGRNYLLDMFLELGKIGVNHIMLVLKYCSRPASEVLEEIGKEVLPHLK